MPFLFAITLFVSATLLFLVQPMVAKMVLPRLGGTPAVWNTCMVFFQAALLAGYAYAHATTTWLSARRQVLAHLVLLVLPLLVLPIALRGGAPPSESNPIPWLLWILVASVGLPFFVLSASAPLLQKWFASTGHPSARDPYFLYAASNLGSMLALLAYPAIIEPNLHLKATGWLSLDTQSGLWAIGYGLFVVCIAGCAWAVWRARVQTPQPELASAVSVPAGRELGEERTELFTREPLHLKQRRMPFETNPDTPDEEDALAAPTALQRLRWLALAFVPSSLMLGVTTYITLDIAAIPMLWVIPLGLYLLSFIIVFTRHPVLLRLIDVAALAGMATVMTLPPLWTWFVHRLGTFPPELTITISLWVARVGLWGLCVFLATRGEPGWFHPKAMILGMPLVVLLLVYIKLAAPSGVVLKIAVHLIALFVVAMVCHGELARSRPATKYLTGYYLIMSLGGVLGGLFNALVAPLVFNSLLEYPLALVMACMLLPPFFETGSSFVPRLLRRAGWTELAELGEVAGWPKVVLDLAVDLALVAVVLMLSYGLVRFCSHEAGDSKWYASLPHWFTKMHQWIMGQIEKRNEAGHLTKSELKTLFMYGPPILLCYLYALRPFRFGLAVGALLWGATAAASYSSWEVLHQERSFFGVLTVDYFPRDETYRLMHGTTTHGWQVRSGGREYEPLTYYHEIGPIGQVFKAMNQRLSHQDIALIGLGSGTLACYGKPDRRLTFYDIDPAVVRIAQNPRYFTYWQNCTAQKQIVLGDARLKIEEAPDHLYKLIVVDAFSSDAIPIHLITKEAIELYFQKMKPDGVLAVHISNRYLELEPVLGNLAAELELTALRQYDQSDDPDRYSSDWVILARKPEDFAGLEKDDSWNPARTDSKVGVWTDDFSNLLSVFEWSN